jgi:uncharacterized protein YbjT (DUF2867 family)
MTELTVAVGATSIQGASVVFNFLKESNYKVRGITRNTNSKEVRRLAKKEVEMVQVDLNDGESLITSFKACYILHYLNTLHEFTYVSRMPQSSTLLPIFTHTSTPTGSPDPAK